MSKDSFVKKSFWLYFLSFAIAPTGYIVKSILSYNFSVADFGVFYGVISFVTIISAYNDMWGTESLNYFLPKHIHNSDSKKFTQSIVYALGMQMLSSAVIGFLLFFGADWLAIHYFSDPSAAQILKVFITFFFAVNIYQVCSTVFSAFRDPKLQKGIEFFRMMMLVSFVLAMWYLDVANLAIYAWSWVIAAALGALLWWILIAKKYHNYFDWSGVSFDSEFFRTFLKYSFWTVLSANSAMLLSQIDMQMVIYILGSESAGYYTNYLSLMRIPFMLITPGIVFLFPVVSGLFAAGNHERITWLRSVCIKFFTVLGFVSGLYLFFFGDIMTTILFSEKFLLSAEILKYSTLFLLFNFWLQIELQVLSGTHRPQKRMKVLTIGLLVNIVTNILFIKYISVIPNSVGFGEGMGVLGPAFATGLGWVLLACIARAMNREYHAPFSHAFFYKNLITFSLLGLGAWHVQNYVDVAGVINGLIYLFAVAGVFGLVLVGLNFRDIRSTLKKLRS